LSLDAKRAHYVNIFRWGGEAATARPATIQLELKRDFRHLLARLSTSSSLRQRPAGVKNPQKSQGVGAEQPTLADALCTLYSNC